MASRKARRGEAGLKRCRSLETVTNGTTEMAVATKDVSATSSRRVRLREGGMVRGAAAWRAGCGAWEEGADGGKGEMDGRQERGTADRERWRCCFGRCGGGRRTDFSEASVDWHAVVSNGSGA